MRAKEDFYSHVGSPATYILVGFEKEEMLVLLNETCMHVKTPVTATCRFNMHGPAGPSGLSKQVKGFIHRNSGDKQNTLKIMFCLQ